MYYSESKKKWLDVTTMNSHHLLNAYARNTDLGDLRDEILRRIGTAVNIAPSPITVKKFIPESTQNGITITITIKTEGQ